MYYSFTKLLALTWLATGGICTPLQRRDFAAVQADVTTLGNQITTLNDTIQAFQNPGGTLQQALAIHNGAQSVMTSLQKGTADVTDLGFFSEDEGSTVLGAVTNFKPAILSSLTGIVDKKPAFQALPVGNLVALIKLDLTYLNGNNTAFASALVNASPDDQKDEATALKNEIDEAFATALAAYQ